jgi:hypothetical protein
LPWHELQAVVQVEHFGIDLLTIHVVQRDLLGNPAEEARVGNRCPDAAGADDCHLG